MNIKTIYLSNGMCIIGQVDGYKVKYPMLVLKRITPNREVIITLEQLSGDESEVDILEKVMEGIPDEAVVDMYRDSLKSISARKAGITIPDTKINLKDITENKFK